MILDNVNLDEEAMRLHINAVDKGFWEPNNEETHTIFYLKQIAMIHSECSEVLEAIRKSKGEQQVVEELADIIIRTLDLYWGLKSDGYTEISLHDTYLDKTAFNESRERMHGVLA
jgi:NTP pyrophosphatase (non-canonical NTP hydrolase)